MRGAALVDRSLFRLPVVLMSVVLPLLSRPVLCRSHWLQVAARLFRVVLDTPVAMP
jgi:hypothetical protein